MGVRYRGIVLMVGMEQGCARAFLVTRGMPVRYPAHALKMDLYALVSPVLMALLGMERVPVLVHRLRVTGRCAQLYD